MTAAPRMIPTETPSPTSVPATSLPYATSKMNPKYATTIAAVNTTAIVSRRRASRSSLSVTPVSLRRVRLAVPDQGAGVEIDRALVLAARPRVPDDRGPVALARADLADVGVRPLELARRCSHR